MVPYSKGRSKATPRFLVLNWLSTVKLKCYLFFEETGGVYPLLRGGSSRGLRGLQPPLLVAVSIRNKGGAREKEDGRRRK